MANADILLACGPSLGLPYLEGVGTALRQALQTVCLPSLRKRTSCDRGFRRPISRHQADLFVVRASVSIFWARTSPGWQALAVIGYLFGEPSSRSGSTFSLCFS